MPSSPAALDLPALPGAGQVLDLRCPEGPAQAYTIAQLARRWSGPLLIVADSEQHAERLKQELRFFSAGDLLVDHMPDPEILPYDVFSPHQEILSERLRVLFELPRRQSKLVIVTADTLTQRVPPRAWLAGRAFDLARGARLSIPAFRAQLIAAGYQSVSEVQTQGEFAVRGALIDLFPMGARVAYRIDLFDDEIDSIRAFDTETQRSTERVEAIRLLPAREFPTDDAAIETFRRNYRAYFSGDPGRSRIYEQVSRGVMPGGIEAYLPLFHERTESLLDYAPADTLIVEVGDLPRALADDWAQIRERHERQCGDIERPILRPEDLFHTPEAACRQLEAFGRVRLADRGQALPLRPLELDGETLALKARDFDGWTDFAADTRRIGLSIGPLEQGLALPGDIWIVAEPQIFGQRAQVSRRRKAVRDPDTLLKDLSSLSIGSPVVHVEHGVGRYAGLMRLEAGGVDSEYLVLEYANDDKLYVPVTALRQIHRYTGAEAESAPLHALGNERWKKARAKAQQRARDVAAELLQIQARRAARAGNAMPVDREAYQRFCAQFPFETTPDQQQAIDAVLADLERPQPMDRVVCGDVGFGKTEVALRAAFVAVHQGYQVCMLAPTTLLAQQHYKNFSDRFADLPVRIAVASRLRSKAELGNLVRDLESGRVDIVIGTHRLLQDDVRFNRLGLVIIDEEHRFGVRHKERMKKLRAEVDLLTLTATPIPRTLNMGLAGLRDLSIIATPPPSRLSIRTFVADWDRSLVHEACQRELRRGGQVYYLHNEVRSIERAAETLAEINPQARVRVAHGQMRERELEQVMLDFYHQRFDILVCSTIIESGIDVPSANTILIDRADKLGLAQLHQLRGRVGRSHHRAYAYLLVPSRQALSGDAAKRLEAIEAMGELGSGFTLATHDLEIRGAGELLGAEQSGQMEEIGFTLYADLLSRAVKAIRSGEIDDAPLEPVEYEVDLGLPALIPDDYVPDIHTRLAMYKRIADAADAASLDELKVEMIDRFGPLPEAAGWLLQLTALRLRMQTIGIRKVRLGDHRITLELDPNPQLDPIRLIRLIQTQPRRFRLEGAQRLHYSCDIDHKPSRPAQLAELFDILTAKD